MNQNNNGNCAGLTYEQAHAAKPVGRLFTCYTVQNNLAPAMMEHIALGEPQEPIHTPVYRGEVVDTLKAQIAELTEQLESYTQAFENMQSKYEQERAKKFSEDGWFLPYEKLSTAAAISLDRLIHRAKGEARVDVITSPGSSRAVEYEADWIKYMVPIKNVGEPFDDQKWIVKLGSAVARFNNPHVIDFKSLRDQEEIIQRLMTRLGEPNSVGLAEAFKQFANELYFGHMPLLDAVQKAAGTDATGLWAAQRIRVEKSPKDVSDSALNDGMQQLAAEPRLGKQAGVVTYNNGRLNFYDMGDTYTADLEVFPVYFEQGKFPKEQVGRGPISVGLDSLYPPQIETGVLIDRILQGSDTSGIEGLKWMDSPAVAELGTKDASAEQTKPVYSKEALNDPTNIQKAVVMGMVGSKTQQEEAREFLSQYLAVNGHSQVAVEAYLKQ